jgi:hypothetical protein
MCSALLRNGAVNTSLHQRTEFSSRVGSCSRELRESPELAAGRIMARKELGCAKKTLCVI